MAPLTDNPGLAIALILALGAAAQWVAWRVSLPAILPLLLTGFLLGPVLGLVDPAEMVGEHLLFPSVSLAVSLILFEGGLTLRLRELTEIRGAVRRLVTVGALVSWLAIAACGYLLVGLDVQLSLLLGALLMVTGPTVIGPLLRIVRPTPKVGNVLKWEGILIDPIGALVAVLVFTYIAHAGSGAAWGQTLLIFGRFILVGSAVGAVSGWAMANLLRLRRIPDFLVNFISLAFVFGAFAISNLFAAESGLLATTLMGMIIANTRIPNLRTILSFKEDLTVLLISVLFIVLAANIELSTLLRVTAPSSLLLLAVIMLVVRPLNVFVSTFGTDFTLRERLYLSWIAPRGIVAAAVSSLFSAELAAQGYEGAETIAPLVFLVIVGTVLLNSITARPLARLLGVAEPDPQGFLILGAHPFARAIGRFLADEGYAVLLADTNLVNVAAARSAGLRAYYGSLLSDQSDDEVRLSGLGNLLALTSNDEANALTVLKYARVFGSNNVFQLEPSRSTSARGRLGGAERGRTLFRKGATFADLRKMQEAGADIEKVVIGDPASGDPGSFLPLFVIDDDKLTVLTDEDDAELTPGTTVAAYTVSAAAPRVPRDSARPRER